MNEFIIHDLVQEWRPQWTLWINVIIIGFSKDQNNLKYKQSECGEAVLHNCDSKRGWQWVDEMRLCWRCIVD